MPLFSQRFCCADACWHCSGKKWEAGSPWLNWALKQYTAALIAAAPLLEEIMALVLPAWSCMHRLSCGSLPIGGETSLCCGPACGTSICCSCARRPRVLDLRKETMIWSRGSFLADPGRLVHRSPHIFFG